MESRKCGDVQYTPNSPDSLQITAKHNTAIFRAEALINDRIGPIPVWIRAPKVGPEFYSGFTRSFLYQLAAQGVIRTVSIREPGKERGCRLFHLQSILEFISRHEIVAQEGK